MKKQNAIIVDIDGTLANCDHRLKYIKQTPKDWISFYAEIGKDKVNKWCDELIYAMDSGAMYYESIFVTGRPEKKRDKTVQWLGKSCHVFLSGHSLFMRPDGDHRQDYVIKKEIYEKHIKPKYKILFVLEDRKQCVDMWRSLGLVCLQCADGDF